MMKWGKRVGGTRKSRNIVIVGFMGTGKTTVSRLLADRLGWRFVDIDEEIVARAGKSIADIFASEGETYFRDLESAVLKEHLAGRCKIIATGGGAVLREDNRRAMLQGGWVVNLTADEATLIDRVRKEEGVRPLLAGNASERVKALKEARRHAYDFAHVAVDTTKRTPSEVTELMLAWR